MRPAWAASHGKDTYLAAQYRRFKRKFGTWGETKAVFAVAHTMIVIVWHLLADEGATYDELGADFFERRTNTEACQRQLIRQLEALGHKGLSATAVGAGCSGGPIGRAPTSPAPTLQRVEPGY